APPVHRSAARIAARAQCRPAPTRIAGRRRPRCVRSPGRLPALAALPLCSRALPPDSAAAVRGRREPGALLFSDRCGAAAMTTLPVLETRALTKHYAVSSGVFAAAARVRALEDVSLSLAPGRTLAVVGESGCGKSTLARQIAMLETPTSGQVVIGGVDAGGADAARRRTLRKSVQMVFQNPFASLNPRKKVGLALEEPLAINTTLGRSEREARGRAMLAKVGLSPEHYRRYPHMFSGGQRQRIAIARALMLEPRLVVADEPVSALDVSIQAQVLNLLMDLQQEMGIAYLFISHNLQVVRHIANEVLVMYLGRAVEYASKDDVFARPAHPYTRALLASTPSLAAGRRRPRIALMG